jgi:predicted transposase YdaD
MGQHDRGYRHLFSHPRLVADLVREILGHRATGPVVLSTLERVGDSFVSARQAARYGDLIWRVSRPDGQWLYLLLEFQARSEPLMAVRVFSYAAQLWEDMIRRGDLSRPDKIPDLLPVVVYHGNRRWRAALDIADLVESRPSRCGVRLRYRLVDQRRTSSRRLWRIGGPLAALFLLERRLGLAELNRAVGLLTDSLTAPEDGELRRAFVFWLRRVLLPRYPLTDEEVPALLDLEEFRSMLEDNVRRWEKQLFQEGRKEGRKEGRSEGQAQGLAKGLAQGEAALLLRQLELKFGPVDETVQAQVRKASSTRRLAWAGRLLTAASLSEVFASRGRRRAE